MGGKRARRRQYVLLCLAGLILSVFSGCVTVEKSKPAYKSPEDSRDHLLRGRDLLMRGDFEGALEENLEVLARDTRQPPEDEAFFNIGVIYLHPDNPKRQLSASTFYFKRVVGDFPSSPWAWQAKAWIETLGEQERLNRKLANVEEQRLQLEIQQKKRDEKAALRQPLLKIRDLFSQAKYEETLREAQKLLSSSPEPSLEAETYFLTGLIFAHPGNPKRDPGKATQSLKKLVREYPQTPWGEMAKIWLGIFQETERLNQEVDRLNKLMERSKQVDIEIEEKRRGR